MYVQEWFESKSTKIATKAFESHVCKTGVSCHLMLVQQGQELVAEVLLALGSAVLQAFQLLPVPRRIQLVILVIGCPV